MALNFAFTADNANFMRSVNEVTASVRNATRQIEANGGEIDRVINMIKSGVATLGIGIGFKEIAGQVSSTRGEFQQLEVALKTIVGSAEEANKLMSQLVRTAAITPFDLQGVANGAKQLLAYGVATDEVNDTLTRLGDIAAGLSLPLNDLVMLYGTTITQGRMFTQDVRQFQGRGIPIVDELTKQFGVAKEKVGDLVTAGKVGAKEFQQAIISMTSEGSKFGGLMEAQSKTITGQISNIQDAIDVMLNDIGKSSEGIINLTRETTGTIVEDWQTVGLILAEIATAYGVEKAILAGTVAVATSSYGSELKALSSLLPVKQENISLDIQEALAKGKITEATAEKVIAMRQEVKSHLESLAATKASAAAEAQAAAQKYRAALQQSLASKAAVEAKRQELIASGQINGAYISENAIKEMGIVTDRAKAASIQSLAAKQEYHAAITKKKIAVDALETAQTNADTVAKNLNARSTNILTVAKEGLTKVTKKLYTTVMAHPYALLTAAIVALGYGIYKLITYQTDYEKGLSRLNEVNKKCEQSISAEAHEIDRLFEKLNQAKKGTKDWETAKDAIWSKYGRYLKALGDEKIALNDVAKAYNLVTQEAMKAAKARAMDNFLQSEGDTYAQDMGEFVERAYQLVKKEKGQKFADSNIEAIRDIIEGRRQVDSSFLKSFNKDKTTFAGISYTENKLADIINQAGKRRKSNTEVLVEAERRFGAYESKPESNITYEPTLKEAYEKAEKDYNEAKALVAKMNANREAYTEKAYETATANLKGYKEAFEKLGGITKEKKSTGITSEQIVAKEESAAGKIADLIRKQGEERLRIEQDYEYERWQSRIDLMKEGEDKILAQMELDHKKERTELERRQKSEEEAELQRQMSLFNAKQDEIAAGNKKYAKKTFRDSDIKQEEFDKITERYKKLYEDLDKAQQKAEQDRLNAAKELMNAYLKEFGSYQEKRLVIQEEYEKKISEAQNEGERMMLTAQRNKALSDLDYDEWVGTGAIALAFGDISKLSDKTVAQLISDMEKYREKVVQTFDPEKIQKYEQALSELRRVQSDKSFGIFSASIPDYFKDRKSIADQMDSSGKNVNALYEQRAAIYSHILSLKEQISRAEENGENTSELNDRLREAEVELSSNAVAAKKAQDSFRILQEQWDQLNTPQEKFEVLCGVISNISGLVDGLASQAAEMAEALGAEGLGEALSYLGDAMDSVGNVASEFAQGGLVGGIAAAAGEVMKWVGKIANAGDNKKQKTIERLQEQIDALNKSYDKLGKAIDEAFSIDASRLIDQQNTLLKQQQALIRQQIMEEESKKKTDSDKIKQYKEQFEEINEAIADNKQKAKEAIIGEDLKSAINEFASLYAEAWDDGTEASQKSMAAVKNIISSALSEIVKKNIQPAATAFYDALSKAMEDGVLTDVELDNLDAIKKQIDALAASSEEQYKMIQERYRDLDELKEELTDVSFDSVRDNFKSLLSDMSSTTKDFGDEVTDILRNSLINGLMDTKYDNMLKEWYDEFAEAMNDRTLTDSERDALRQHYDARVRQGLEDRDFINSIVGGGAYSQEASKGWSTTLTQDQGAELNGRFTALTELEAINNTLVSEGNMISAQILDTLRSLSSLGMVTDSDNSTLRDIRDMMFLSTGHLEDISKYTKQLITISDGINRLNDLINKRL